MVTSTRSPALFSIPNVVREVVRGNQRAAELRFGAVQSQNRQGVLLRLVEVGVLTADRAAELLGPMARKVC